MRDPDIPERAARDLSTEDIANPSPARSGADEPAPANGADDRQTSEPPPMYPGESTDTRDLEAEPDDSTPEERSDTAGGSTSATESTQGYEDAAPDTRSQGDTRAEPAGGSAPADAVSHAADDEDESPRLLSGGDEESFRSRWHEIQSLFVDDPREAVHAADGLVADVMQTLAATFSDHKARLEGQWSEGEGVDTESLRVALRQYRSFFNRLLTK